MINIPKMQAMTPTRSIRDDHAPIAPQAQQKLIDGKEHVDDPRNFIGIVLCDGCLLYTSREGAVVFKNSYPEAVRDP